MQLYESFRGVEHLEIEHQKTSHQMLWSQLESKFTMNTNHVLIIFNLTKNSFWGIFPQKV